MRSSTSYNGVYSARDSSDAGHLIIAGKDSLLKLIEKNSSHISKNDYHDMHGTLTGGKKASLLQCIRTRSTHYSSHAGPQHECDYFPHYVVLGKSFINSTDATVRAIHYHFENVHCLVSGH